MTSPKTGFVLPTLLLGLSMAPVVNASSFTFTGTLQQDDNVQLFGFTVDTLSAVTLETWSYGGGVNAVGQPVSNGGFMTVLSLYSSSGSLIDFALPGNCPPGNLDRMSGLCGDALLNRPLGSGSYLLALTEFFNIPNGLTLADGFLQSGAGNFTGPLLCGVQGGFLDSSCNQRNGNFEVDIVGAATAAVIPEPASIVLVVFGVIGFVAWSVAIKPRRDQTIP